MNNLAVFLKTVRNKYENAEGLYREVLEGRKKHPDTLRSMNNLAVFLDEVRNKYDGAEGLKEASEKLKQLEQDTEGRRHL